VAASGIEPIAGWVLVTMRWMLSSRIEDLPHPHSRPWTCQLMYAECSGPVLTLDFVALEPFPTIPSRCPRHTPFTLQIGAPGEADAKRMEATLATWHSHTDVVTIVAGDLDGQQWLCLAAGERFLVVEMMPPTEPNDG
jgi:hypothetical protein